MGFFLYFCLQKSYQGEISLLNDNFLCKLPIVKHRTDHDSTFLLHLLRKNIVIFVFKSLLVV